MSNKLLEHYQEELAFLKKEAGKFAKDHPKVASKLKLGEDELRDPLIDHLISSVAFLNARIQHRIDESFPEYSTAILDALYPHYTRPIPASSIAQFDLSAYTEEGITIKPKTPLATEEFSGQHVTFRTSGSAQIIPVVTSSAELLFKPCPTPQSNTQSGNAVIHIELKLNDSINAFSDLDLNEFRFYIGGRGDHRSELYEQLISNATGIVIAENTDGENASTLPSDSIYPIGFEEQEQLLPYPDNALSGYRLLTEFFAYQEKFMFFSITNISTALKKLSGKTCHLYIYLKDAPGSLEHKIEPENFSLGCTAVTNLFQQLCDPIRLDLRQTNYLVQPDVTAYENHEIYDISSVNCVNTDGVSETLRNYFSNRPLAHTEQDSLYWISEREVGLEGGITNELASNVSLSFVNKSFNGQTLTDKVITVDALCFNRNSVSKLPYHEGVFLTPIDSDLPPIQVKLISPPSSVLRTSNSDENYWKLISHLKLNFLSLDSGSQALENLKQILRLYDFRDSSSTKSLIDAIVEMRTKQVSATIKLGDRYAPAIGQDILLTFDKQKLGSQSPFLFASVLERFFALYCSINSFTRTSYQIRGHEQVSYTWPPRSGEQALI